jgi:predicted phage terminase large subunit-like protein
MTEQEKLRIAAKRLDLRRKAMILQARTSFRIYRRLINPRLKDGWFRRAMEIELEHWWDDFKAGKRPVLLLSTPPQFGKSILIIDFISWISGKDPALRTIFASFSERLGVRANLRLQRIFDTSLYAKVFPKTSINTANAVSISGQHLRNREILEFVDQDGYFRNTTVGGPVTGESLDIGIIDDPVKGREEANSETMREKVWDWFTDDFSTRFSDFAGMILIMTRWHVDDLAGRIIDTNKSAKTLVFKAIAEDDEEHRKAGESLFPELKSIEFLLNKKSMMRLASWFALYQGSPIIEGGDMIMAERIHVVDRIPGKIIKSVRYWDKAGTEDGGAYSAGVLLHQLDTGKFVIADVIRGQWSSGRRELTMRQTAVVDTVRVPVWVEQEPGSGGKESAENTVTKTLVGFSVFVDKVSGDKVTRAEPFAAQVEFGNVVMLRAEWNKEYLDEARMFPNGKYKDQIDATSGAFNKLVGDRILILE